MKYDTYAKGGIHDKNDSICHFRLYFSLLFISLLAGLAPNLSSKVVALGESIWPNYAQDLRKDLPEPECPLEDLQQKVSQCPADISNIPTNVSQR